MELTEEFLATDYTDKRIAEDGSESFTAADGRHTITYSVIKDEAVAKNKLVTVTSRFTSAGGLTQTITLKCFKPFID